MGMAGRLAKLYYAAGWANFNPAPIPLSDFTEECQFADLAFNGTKAEADISSRCSDFQIRTGGLIDGQIQATYVFIKGDDNFYEQMVSSWINNKPLYWMLLDGVANPVPTEGNKGWMFPGEIFDMSETFPLNDAAATNITILPTFAQDAAGGAGNFLTIQRVIDSVAQSNPYDP